MARPAQAPARAGGPAAPEEAGFTLAEALVALALIAAATGLFVESLAGNARARAMVRNKREAILLAQTVLAAAGDQTESSGTWRNLTWRLDREPYSATAAFAGNRLDKLVVTVESRDHVRLVRLATAQVTP